jgi:hypothetical protein
VFSQYTRKPVLVKGMFILDLITYPKRCLESTHNSPVASNTARNGHAIVIAFHVAGQEMQEPRVHTNPRGEVQKIEEKDRQKGYRPSLPLHAIRYLPKVVTFAY